MVPVCVHVQVLSCLTPVDWYGGYLCWLWLTSSLVMPWKRTLIIWCSVALTGGCPCHVVMEHRMVPRSWRLSRHTWPSDFLSIQELSECGHALWSLMSHRSVECGLGTVLMRGLYIPVRSSELNKKEYLPSMISMSHCSHTNFDAGGACQKVKGYRIILIDSGVWPCSFSQWTANRVDKGMVQML